MITMEQLTECMPTGLRIWLKERKPKALEKVGELADDYISARKSAKEAPRRCHCCNKISHVAAECGSRVPAEQKQAKLASGQTMAGNQGRVHLQPRCYRYNKLGHIATKCPENKGATWQQRSHYQPPMRHSSTNFVTTRDGMHGEVKQFEEIPVKIPSTRENRGKAYGIIVGYWMLQVLDRCQSRSTRKDSARGMCVNTVRPRRLEVISYCNFGRGSRREDVYIKSGSGGEPIEICIVGKRCKRPGENDYKRRRGS